LGHESHRIQGAQKKNEQSGGGNHKKTGRKKSRELKRGVWRTTRQSDVGPGKVVGLPKWNLGEGYLQQIQKKRMRRGAGAYCREWETKVMG